MAIVNQKLVKNIFHDKNKRVPKGYLSALQSLVAGIVEQSALNDGTIRKESVMQLAEKSACPTMGRHVNSAFEKLESEGRLDSGFLMPTANQIAQEEGDKK